MEPAGTVLEGFTGVGIGVEMAFTGGVGAFKIPSCPAIGVKGAATVNVGTDRRTVAATTAKERRIALPGSIRQCGKHIADYHKC